MLLVHIVEPGSSPIILQHLAGEGLRSRVNVAGRDGVVDVDQDARVGGLVSTRERSKIRGRRASTTRHVELSARQVELCASYTSSSVDSDVLVAHQVLARRNALGDRNIVVGGS